MGGVVSVACQGFLVREACVGVLLGIPLSLHLVYIAEFGVVFLYSGSFWSSLYYGVASLNCGKF